MATEQARALSHQEQVKEAQSILENAFTGSQSDESPAPEGEQEVTDELVEQQAGDDVTPSEDTLDESLEASEDDAGSEDTDGEVEGIEVEEIQTISDFAKAAGWEPEQLYGLNVKLDTGEEIPLGQVKDRLQQYTRQESELAAQREQLVQEQQQLQQAAQQQFMGQQAMSQEMMEAQNEMASIQAKYNSVNWDELSEKDPGRAALAQQQIAAEYAGAKQRYGQAVGVHEQQKQQYLQQSLVEHDQKFIEAVPEWKDPKVVETEGPAIQAFLREVGFSTPELERIYDHRARIVARDAWLWRQHQAKVQEATGKVQKAPKQVLRPGRGPGAAQTSSSKQQRELNAKMQRAKETRNRNDQVAAIDALLSSQRR